ncbi:MAG: hypothetical protein ACPLRX_02370 [Candidatus Saccharicenans sp.]
MNMKTTKGLKIVSLAALVILLISCNPLEKDYKSNSFIVIQSIIGKDNLGNDSTVVFSDVLTNNVAYSDFVTVTLKAATLDPNPIMGTSQYSDIMLTRCVITYLPADGSAPQEGVNVPAHYEVSLSQLLPVGTNVSFPLMIVRDVAKVNPPLSALAGDPTGLLECVARIDFYGHDLRNRDVTQVGFITVRFADYVDQTTGGGTYPLP